MASFSLYLPRPDEPDPPGGTNALSVVKDLIAGIPELRADLPPSASMDRLAQICNQTGGIAPSIQASPHSLSLPPSLPSLSLCLSSLSLSLSLCLCLSVSSFLLSLFLSLFISEVGF